MDKNRFINLWKRNSYSFDLEKVNQLYEKMHELYIEPQRHYHNANHINDSLRYFDHCKSNAQFPDAIEMAIWFHDCIYVICALDNESLSRDFYLENSKGHLVPEIRKRTAELIMDTCHIDVPDTEDGKLIVDIDLTSFGLSWDDYLKDSNAVSKELVHLNAKEKIDIKIKFLNNLLANGQVYYSNLYLIEFEQIAQANVKKHLQLL